MAGLPLLDSADVDASESQDQASVSSLVDDDELALIITEVLRIT